MTACVTIPSDADTLDHSPVSMRVIRALGDATDAEFDAISPLYESTDPDALDALCEHARDRSTRLELTFSHDGVDVEVRVSPGGEIRIDAAP